MRALENTSEDMEKTEINKAKHIKHRVTRGDEHTKDCKIPGTVF